MGGVDAVKRAVGTVAVDGVFHYHGALVPGNIPLVVEGLRHAKRVALAVGSLEIVDVFGELVERVAAGR